jgi:peptide-methionine (R)-S-oxide reductase
MEGMNESNQVQRSEDEWRRELSPSQYAVLRESATEPPFTGVYTDTEDPGVYRCAGCKSELFRSDAKFHSGSGWPSFTEPAFADVVELVADNSHGPARTEVRCARCGGHLGHVFDDGPRDRGGLRYCINSAALQLDPTAD